MTETDLAGLVGARLCHDLGGPLGAVANGIDLMREIGGAEASDELAMLERSAQRAAALLNFHRVAFGAVRDHGAVLPRTELLKRAKAALAGPRLEIACPAANGPALSAPAARLAALLLLAGRGALGMGGTLRLLLPAAGDLPLAVMAESARARLGDDQRRWLEGSAGPGPDAPEIEFGLIPPAAAALGAQLDLKESEGRVALRALPI